MMKFTADLFIKNSNISMPGKLLPGTIRVASKENNYQELCLEYVPL